MATLYSINIEEVEKFFYVNWEYTHDQGYQQHISDAWLASDEDLNYELVTSSPFGGDYEMAVKTAMYPEDYWSPEKMRQHLLSQISKDLN